jgi:hypothetical protein
MTPCSLVGGYSVYQRINYKMFENRVLKRIFGPKRDKVTGGWRKLHNEELKHYIYIYMDEGMAMNIFREKENMVLVLLSDRVAGFL